jgi:signal peptide peptidase SppA
MTQKMVAGTAAISSNKEKNLGDVLLDILTLEFFKSNKKRVAVLSLQGVIGKVGGMRGNGMTLESMNPLIEKAFGHPKIKAVCLAINSPGGSPVQSELIAKRIIDLSKEKKIPVYAFVEDVAASGGYWLACSASEIYASKSSIVGSIGVISSSFGMVDAISKLGIERRVYTAGKNKSILDPFLPAKQDDIKLLKKIQQGVHSHFIDYVKSRRGGKLTQNDDILFNGEFWNGDIAYDYGLVDGIDDLYSFIKRKFGEKTKIEYISAKESWFKKRMGIISESFADNLSSKIKTDIAEIIKDSRYNLD